MNEKSKCCRHRLTIKLFLGKIIPPSDGTSLTFTAGSTEKIVWSFTDDITTFSTRTWIFTPSNGQSRVGLAKIDGDGDVQIFTTLFEVAVEKPATLVLKNVNLTYNGTYHFSLIPDASPSEVVVYIAGKFLKSNALLTNFFSY